MSRSARIACATHFYPFGMADTLEVALVTAHAAQMTLPQEIQTVFEMCTTKAAKACSLSGYGFGAGQPADIVILDAALRPRLSSVALIART